MSSEEPSTSASESPAHPEAPPTYPKIPPPPMEQPPPYTPFGGQTSSLLPQQNAHRQQADYENNNNNNRSRRIVYPPGIRKYLQYVTVRNVFIALAVLLGLALFIHVIRWSNASDREMLESGILPGTKPLDVEWLSLGEYNKSLDRLSYDEFSDMVILSQYNRDENLLHCESVNVDNHLSGFRKFQQNISKPFEDCVCFTKRAHCCQTSAESRHHQTECFLNENEELIHSVAVMFDFVPNWQSLTDGERLLLLHNRQRNSVLDLRSKRVQKIEENRLPANYVSMGFFFPMDTADELDELVRSGDEFRICDYLKTGVGDYILKDEQCTKLPFTVEFELPKVKFCSNPLYTAVIQYGHLASETRSLTWHLRVKYDSSRDVFSASDSFDATKDEIVMDCNDKEIDIFVLGTHELHQYTVGVPDLRSEHFIQTRI